MVQPMDTLKYLLDGNFYGINAGTNLPIFNSGIEIGFDYSWARLEHKDEDFVINYFVSVTGQYVYENATMYLQNRNNRYVTNLRLRPFNGRFQPSARAHERNTLVDFNNLIYSSLGGRCNTLRRSSVKL
jgi:hypothetical protein